MGKLSRTRKTRLRARNQNIALFCYRFQGGGGSHLPTEREVGGSMVFRDYSITFQIHVITVQIIIFKGLSVSE